MTGDRPGRIRIIEDDVEAVVNDNTEETNAQATDVEAEAQPAEEKVVGQVEPSPDQSDAVSAEPEHLTQVLSLHEAHSEVDTPFLVDPDLVNGQDARVVELCRNLGFLEEASQAL